VIDVPRVETETYTNGGIPFRMPQFCFFFGNPAAKEPAVKNLQRSLHFADIFVPNRGILANVFRHHRDTFRRIQIDDIHA
jgi:hypothetical protein